jgi:type III pantothenate kinase
MLLAVDVGNTNTVLGLFDLAAGPASAASGATTGVGDSPSTEHGAAARAEELRAFYRLETRKSRTGDEYAATLDGFLQLSGLPGVREKKIRAVVVATVVPPVMFAIGEMCKRHLGVEPVVIGPGIKTGMPILYENPREVGADRIVNAVAAYERWKQGLVIIDFGTATTFDVVTPKGEYLGGAIAPGVGISADALYHHAAKLPRVEVTRPKVVIGRNTVASMQSGLYFGYVGLVDGVVQRMQKEVDFPTKVVATGGLAPLIAKESKTIEDSDEMLTLWGLKIIFDRNR